MNNTKQNIKTALFEMPVSDFYKEILDKQAMQIHGCIGPNSTFFPLQFFNVLYYNQSKRCDDLSTLNNLGKC